MTDEIRRFFKKLEKQSLQREIDLATQYRKIRDEQLYLDAGYPTFEDFAQGNGWRPGEIDEFFDFAADMERHLKAN